MSKLYPLSSEAVLAITNANAVRMPNKYHTCCSRSSQSCHKPRRSNSEQLLRVAAERRWQVSQISGWFMLIQRSSMFSRLTYIYYCALNSSHMFNGHYHTSQHFLLQFLCHLWYVFYFSPWRAAISFQSRHQWHLHKWRGSRPRVSFDMDQSCGWDLKMTWNPSCWGWEGNHSRLSQKIALHSVLNVKNGGLHCVPYARL